MILSTSELGGAIDRAVFPNMQGGPLEHVIAAKAVAFGEAMNIAYIVEDYTTSMGIYTSALGAMFMGSPSGTASLAPGRCSMSWWPA